MANFKMNFFSSHFLPLFKGEKDIQDKSEENLGNPSLLLLVTWMEDAMQAGSHQWPRQPWQSIASTCVFALGVHLQICTF